MHIKIQVNKNHYSFEGYMTKERWASLWHQLNIINSLNLSGEILEIGIGSGVLKNLARNFGVIIKTLDIDPDLEPDYVGSVMETPFKDNEFELVCAFQVLEHLPYADALAAFDEMVRISQRYIIISLPDSRKVFRYSLHIPKFGVKDLMVPRVSIFSEEHVFDGEHYWEIGKRGYGMNKVISDLENYCKLKCSKRIFENPYHHFFVFEKR